MSVQPRSSTSKKTMFGGVFAAATYGNKLIAKHYRDVGGTEGHVLTVTEMPGHTHALDLTSVGDDGKTGNLAFIEQKDGRKRHTTYSTGGNAGSKTAAPHNNMPPYVALYFCKKTGK